MPELTKFYGITPADVSEMRPIELMLYVHAMEEAQREEKREARRANRGR